MPCILWGLGDPRNSGVKCGCTPFALLKSWPVCDYSCPIRRTSTCCVRNRQAIRQWKVEAWPEVTVCRVEGGWATVEKTNNIRIIHCENVADTRFRGFMGSAWSHDKDDTVVVESKNVDVICVGVPVHVSIHVYKYTESVGTYVGHPGEKKRNERFFFFFLITLTLFLWAVNRFI